MFNKHVCEENSYLCPEGGFFRYYELIYNIADERDVVRLRTNYRTGEEVYLYHTRVTREGAQAIFLDYLSRTNRMRDHAEWYNALTNNEKDLQPGCAFQRLRCGEFCA